MFPLTAFVQDIYQANKHIMCFFYETFLKENLSMCTLFHNHCFKYFRCFFISWKFNIDVLFWRDGISKFDKPDGSKVAKFIPDCWWHEGFFGELWSDLQTGRQTHICYSRVAFVTEKWSYGFTPAKISVGQCHKVKIGWTYT